MEEKTNLALKEIVLDNNKLGLSVMQAQLNEFRKTITNEDDYIIKNAIIDFFLIVNPFSNKWKEEEMINISNYFFKYYSGMIGSDKLKYIFFGLKNPLLKFLIQIDDIFPIEKEQIKLAFKIILLTQDNKMIINYIKSYLLSDIEDIENEINNINFNNPFAIIFMHSLFNLIFSKKSKTRNILDKINNKMKKIQTFRCNKCFDLLYIIHINNITSLICNNSSHTIVKCEKLEDLEKLNNYDLQCCECCTKLKLYYDNYKCIICKKFVCYNCIKNHYETCPASELIYLYNVGYTCEQHNKKFIDTCDMCKKNLCEICKSFHYHIIKEQFKLKLNDKVIQDYLQVSELNTTEKYIKYHLSKKYRYMEKFQLVNLKIKRALYFIDNSDKDLQFKPVNFFCSKFYNDDFKEYYKQILIGAQKRKIAEYEGLIKLKNEYIINNLFSNDEEYDKFINLCQINQKKRKSQLKNFYPYVSDILLSFWQLFEKIPTIISESKIKENNIDILLLKNKINKFDKSYKIDQLFIKKLLSRYFADYIIKILIKNYPTKFKPINLTLINIYEIISYYGINIISNDKLDSIKSLIENILSMENNLNEYLKNYLQKCKVENQVIFNDSISIDGETIKKEELNFVLGALLYLKKIGNIAAHPNIESSIDSEIVEISKNIKQAKELINQNEILINNDDNISLIDSKLKKTVKEVLNKLKDEIVKDLKEISFNKNVKVEYILDYIFKNKTEDITKDDLFSIRTIILNIESIINDEMDFKEENLFSGDDNDSIGSYKDALQLIYTNEKLLRNKILQFKDYDIRTNERLESDMKSEIKKHSLLTFSTFSILFDNYVKILNEDLSEDEKKSYIISIFAKEYLDNKFIQKKKKMEDSLKELIKFTIIDKKVKRIYDLIKNLYKDDKTDFNDALFLDEIKKYIIEMNFQGCEYVSKKEISLERIIEILKLLIKEKNLNWLVLSAEKTASISSFLYYMQNKRG